MASGLPFGVLVLPRPSAREDGTSGNKTSPSSSLGKNLKENIGEPKEAVSKHRDRAAAAVSNNRVNEA
jgi:hypothetical protein